MIEPYNAVGLVPTVWGISTRGEIIEHAECAGDRSTNGGDE